MVLTDEKIPMEARQRHIDRTFQQRIRDLFRHLDDARRLRQNPLVSSYFAECSGDLSDDDILLKLRSDILSAARSVYRWDASHGQQVQASRSFAIIRGLCRGLSAKEIACELNVSLPQFYRNRREAMVRTIGAFTRLRQTFAVVDPQRDVLQLRLVRLATLIDQGFAQRAVTEAEALLGVVATKREAILILCELSRAAFEFGKLGRAKELCTLARQKVEGRREERQSTDGLQSHIELAEFYVSCMEDGPATSYRRIAALADRMRRPYGVSDDRNFALLVMLDTCRSAVLVGKVAEARDALDFASHIALDPGTRPTLQGQVDFIRAYAAGGEATSAERLESLTTALRAAQRVGSANGVMLAALGLADYFVWRRQERQAREHSEIAYSVAQATEGAYLIACVVDAIAAILLRTSEWEYAATILREAPLPAAPYYAMRSASFEAQVLLRQGDDRTATDLLTQAAREAERMHQFRSLAMILPDLALAQLRRGHPETALSKAREAKEIVWRFGSASMQRLARERLKFLNVR